MSTQFVRRFALKDNSCQYQIVIRNDNTMLTKQVRLHRFLWTGVIVTPNMATSNNVHTYDKLNNDDSILHTIISFVCLLFVQIWYFLSVLEVSPDVLVLQVFFSVANSIKLCNNSNNNDKNTLIYFDIESTDGGEKNVNFPTDEEEKNTMEKIGSLWRFNAESLSRKNDKFANL